MPMPLTLTVRLALLSAPGHRVLPRSLLALGRLPVRPDHNPHCHATSVSLAEVGLCPGSQQRDYRRRQHRHARFRVGRAEQRRATVAPVRGLEGRGVGAARSVWRLLDSDVSKRRVT
eukprot:3887220-Rhodomonas_salina.1